MTPSSFLVYLSGPLSATSERSIEEHMANAADAYFTLAKSGIPAICVHMVASSPSAWTSGMGYEDWMRLDLKLLDHCTHLDLLPYWQESRGAVREFNHWMERHPTGLDSDDCPPTVYEELADLIKDLR